jgi:hypothetical protein
VAAKTFAINTKPHEAVIGVTTLYFVPEMVGGDFTGAYLELAEVQKKISAKGEEAGLADFAAISEAMRDFLSKLMTSESAKVFATLALPDRILVQLIEWTAELFGGSSGKDVPTGPSSSS